VVVVLYILLHTNKIMLEIVYFISGIKNSKSIHRWIMSQDRVGEVYDEIFNFLKLILTYFRRKLYIILRTYTKCHFIK